MKRTFLIQTLGSIRGNIEKEKRRKRLAKKVVPFHFHLWIFVASPGIRRFSWKNRWRHIKASDGARIDGIGKEKERLKGCCCCADDSEIAKKGESSPQIWAIPRSKCCIKSLLPTSFFFFVLFHRRSSSKGDLTAAAAAA